MAEDTKVAQPPTEPVNRKRRHDFANRYTALHSILVVVTVFGGVIFGVPEGVISTVALGFIGLAGAAQTAYLGGSVVDYVNSVRK